MTTEPYVAVVIVNYRTADDVAGLLASLVRSDGAELLRVCVVDNSQDPRELERLRAIIEMTEVTDIVLRPAPENVGYGRGNNIGIRALQQRYGDPATIVIANPDTRVKRADFRRVLESTRSGTLRVARTSGDAQSRGLYRMSRPTGRALPIPSLTGRARDLVYPNGHFLVIDFKDWRRAQGFHDGFFLYGEELDLALTLDSLRPRIVSMVTDCIHVTHEGGGSTGSTADEKSLVTYREATRSRFVLYRRHVHLRAWVPVLLVMRCGLATTLLLRRRPREAMSVIRGAIAGVQARQVVSQSQGHLSG